jgi:putative transposase
MTNHVHLLITPLQQQSLSLTMQTLGRKYVRYINGVYRRTGTLWEGRYKSAIIDSERYLLTCSRYIELNPVRANMVVTPGAYRWSSYRANALGHKNILLTPHRSYIELGASEKERQEAYSSLFSADIDENALNLIRDGTQQGTVIGGSQFQEEIKVMLKRRVMKHKHGGDRKSKVFKEISSDLTP